MKFKYAQNRVVRYVVVIDAESRAAADEQLYNQDEWREEAVEECDPPWYEDCPENEDPDIYVVHGRVVFPREHAKPKTSGMRDCDGKQISIGSRVAYSRGAWDGAPWFPGTVMYLYGGNYGEELRALVEDDDKRIKAAWIPSARLRLLEEEAPVAVSAVAVVDHGDEDSVDPVWWERETPLTPEEVVTYRAEVVASQEGDPSTVLTCDTCPRANICTLAFDTYNTDGDCLAEK